MEEKIQIIPLGLENMSGFNHMIPDELLDLRQQQEEIILGAVGPENTPMGVAVFKEYAHYMELVWIYVEPEFRRMGICSQLIKRMEDSIEGNSYFAGVYADYKQGLYEGLDIALGKLGFEKELQDWSSYSFTLNDAFSLEKFSTKKALSGKKIYNLSECTSEMKSMFSSMLSKSDEPYLVELPIDWKRYNQKFSCVHADKGKISSVFLVEAEERIINIAFVYAKDNPYILPYMMGYSFKEIANKYPDRKVNFTVTALEENTENIVLKLVPGAKNVGIIHAKKMIMEVNNEDR